MHTNTPSQAGFKRQVVFRIGADDWPLLEQAVCAHGSIQAAVLAGLRALTDEAPEPEPAPSQPRKSKKPALKCTERAIAADRPVPLAEPAVNPAGSEEITAREAAKLLGLKTTTIKGYIRSGRLRGRYDETPGLGWLTSRAAAVAYRRR